VTIQPQGSAALPLGKDLQVCNKQKAACIPDPEWAVQKTIYYPCWELNHDSSVVQPTA